MKAKAICILLCIVVLSSINGYAANPASVDETMRSISRDKKDLERFLNFRTNLRSDISKKEKAKIDFAMAEYYFKLKDYSDAQRAFGEYVANNPQGISALLANVYLCKLAELYGKGSKAMDIKKDMFKDQFILLFDKFKVLNYVSLNENQYAIHYFVDRIEIYLNGDIFEQISP